MNSESQRRTIGLIIPCYNEEEVLGDLVARLQEFAAGSAHRINVLFVNDGSSDRTRELLQQHCTEQSNMACIHFSRNFGHQAAVSAGLAHVQGDAAVVLDADLQDPPEVIPEMIAKWIEGYDVVYGIRQKRKENWFLKLCYFLFYRVMNSVATFNMAVDAGDFALMDRRIIDQMNAMPEKCRFVRGLRSWVGFRQVGVPYEREARQAGDSKYSYVRLFKLAMDGIIAYSVIPLRIAVWLGILSSLVGMLYFVYVLFTKLVLNANPPGWSSLASIILLMGGMQLVVMGIIGEYIGRVFDEVKGRPTYIIDEITGSAQSGEGP